MKKIQITQNLKSGLIAIILLVGISLAGANSWSNPTADPKNANSAAPINEGTIGQEKYGSITIGGGYNMSHAPVVTYSPLHVGLNTGSTNLEADTSFYGKLNLLKLVDLNNTSNDQPLCATFEGKVKVCSQGVVFEPVQDVYYTTHSAGTISFPSGGVTGAVKYEVDPALTCTTKATSNTDWGAGTTITGSNNNYSIKFNDWGKYTISMDCGVSGSSTKKTYSVVITIKGKAVATPGSGVNKYRFPNNATLYFSLQGGGASGISATPTSTSCLYGGDGLSSFAHITSSSTWTPNSQSSSNTGATYNSGANVAHAGGGVGAQKIATKNHVIYDYYGFGKHEYCGPAGQGNGQQGKGGNVIINNLSGSSAKSGSDASLNNSSGGCPGSKLSGCSSNQEGKGGDGKVGYYGLGGGGGSYVIGNKTVNANDYVYLYAAGTVAGSSSGYDGKAGFAQFEW